MKGAQRRGAVTQRTLAVSAAVLTLAAVSSGGPARAQGEAAPKTKVTAAAADVRVPAMTMERVTLSEAVARIAKATGARVVVDKTLLSAPVSFQTLGGPLAAVLKELTAKLPTGSEVKATLLPAPGANALDGDAVAALVAAEEAMLKKATAAQTSASASVPILGALVSAEQAPAVIDAMKLERVYLLTNPNAVQDPVQRAIMAQTDALRNWMGLTPEQKAASMDQQLDSLINMDPAARRSLFSQQTELGMKFMQKIQTLPEAQRKQFWSDMTGGRFDGTIPQRPAGGGAGAGGATP